MPSVPQKVRSLYLHFNRNTVESLGDVYTDDLQFKDPLHAINGLSSLRRYYEYMLENLVECRFEFHHSIEDTERGEAILFWTMHYRHKKLDGGKPLELTGNSHILFNTKVYYHRDYFDAGAMLYENIPLLGWFIKTLKKRLTWK